MNCGPSFCYSGSVLVDDNNTNDFIAIDMELYDYAGNFIQYINAISSIRVDTQRPTISQLNIYSDNANSTYAISGDTVYVYFESDNELLSGSVFPVIA